MALMILPYRRIDPSAPVRTQPRNRRNHRQVLDFAWSITHMGALIENLLSWCLCLKRVCVRIAIETVEQEFVMKLFTFVTPAASLASLLFLLAGSAAAAIPLDNLAWRPDSQVPTPAGLARRVQAYYLLDVTDGPGVKNYWDV